MTSARRRRWVMGLGFVAAIAVLVVLFWFLGVDDMLATLGRADPRTLVLVGLVAAGWLVAWALTLRTVLAILEIHVTVLEAVLIFAATVFANNVTPFGQAGGEPIGALLIASIADSEYETGLASMVSFDALKLLPAIGFGLLGLAFYAATVTLSDRLETAALTLLAVAIVLPAIAVALWRRRRRAEDGFVYTLSTLLRGVSHVVPRLEAPAPAAIRRRFQGFITALEQVADDPRTVVAALSLTALGWLGLIGCLWLSFVALGETDPTLLAASFVAVPLGSVAAATPFPGGLGGMEAALVAVLTPLTAVPVATIGAAVVCYRIATYWLPTFVGGAVTGAFGSTARW